MRKLFAIISLLLWAIPAHAQCTLLWQTPVAHFPSDPAPRPPVTLSGPTSWSASMSCPAGVIPTQVCIDYGCPDATNSNGTSLLTYDGQPFSCASGIWPPPPFQPWTNPNGYRGPYCVAGAQITSTSVSFTLDPTTLMPGTSANPVPYDVNIGVTDSAGNVLGGTPRTCAPNGDCDIQIYVAAGPQTAPPSSGESPNCSSVGINGSSLTDTGGNTLSINSSKVVVYDGNSNTSTANVTLLVAYNGVIYQENTAGNWYIIANGMVGQTGSSWEEVSAPPCGNPTPSPTPIPSSGSSGGFEALIGGGSLDSSYVIDAGFFTGTYGFPPAAETYLYYQTNPYQQFIFAPSGSNYTICNVESGACLTDGGNVVDIGQGTDTWAVTQSGAGWTLQDTRTGQYMGAIPLTSESNIPMSSTPVTVSLSIIQ